MAGTMIAMRNLLIEQDGDDIVIRIKASKDVILNAPASSTGKTLLICSTRGSVPLDSPHVDGMWLTLNVYASRPK
jgi:hypothetical protein